MKPSTLLLSAAALLASAEPARAQVTAIRGATVYVEPGVVEKDATVVFDGDTIIAAGKGVAIPGGATVIDGTGKIVTAGLVEASTDLGLTEVGEERLTVEGAFARTPDQAIHAAYRVIDGFNPRSVAIPIARTGGITSAVATPRGGLVAGSSAWMMLRDGGVSDMLVKAPLAMYVTLGERAELTAHGSRGLAVEELRELLDDAREYARRRGAFERNQTRKFAAERLDLAALGPVVNGRLPLVVRVDKAADILAALGVAREFGARLIIEGGTEAWMVARELAAARVPVILDPIDNLPRDFDRIHVRDDAPAILAKAGVTIAISTLGSGAFARTLRQRAGNAIRAGLPPDAALAAVTTGPAAIFAIRDRGRIARGEAADLVVWSGDPFELSTQAEHVFIGGQEQSLVTHQTLLFRRYR